MKASHLYWVIPALLSPAIVFVREAAHGKRLCAKAIYRSGLKTFHHSVLVALALTSLDARAAVIDPAAKAVTVSKTCTDANGNARDNCFTSINGAVGWMASTRKPNATNPLAVNIEPGNFHNGENITIICDPANGYTGYASFVGSGREQSLITGPGSGNASPLNVHGCTEMNFSNLRIAGKGGFAYGGVYWFGGGNSTWSDVDIISNGRAWIDSECGTTRGQHRWYSSRIHVHTAFTVGVPYVAECDETWFYGSEIVSETASGQNLSGGGAVVAAGGQGIIHVYGSNLRAFMFGTVNNVRPTIASVSGDGEIHIHGTGLDLISTSAANFDVLLAAGHGKIHANVSAFNFNVPSGATVTRIAKVDGGHVHAPYLWGHIPDTDDNPSTIDTNFVSVNGVDQTTVTTGTSDGHPHPAIYSTGCPNTARWYDTVDKVCRGQ
jgi:hypothetical protein